LVESVSRPSNYLHRVIREPPVLTVRSSALIALIWCLTELLIISVARFNTSGVSMRAETAITYTNTCTVSSSTRKNPTAASRAASNTAIPQRKSGFWNIDGARDISIIYSQMSDEYFESSFCEWSKCTQKNMVERSTSDDENERVTARLRPNTLGQLFGGIAIMVAAVFYFHSFRFLLICWFSILRMERRFHSQSPFWELARGPVSWFHYGVMPSGWLGSSETSQKIPDSQFIGLLMTRINLKSDHAQVFTCCGTPAIRTYMSYANDGGSLHSGSEFSHC